MKKTALRFLLIGAVLLILGGAYAYYYAEYQLIGKYLFGPMMLAQEMWRAYKTEQSTILTTAELLMVCGVALFGVAAFITITKTFKLKKME